MLARKVKNLSAVHETRVWSLGEKDPLEKGMAPHFNILAWRIPWTEDHGGYRPWGWKESDTTERLTLHDEELGSWISEVLTGLSVAPSSSCVIMPPGPRKEDTYPGLCGLRVFRSKTEKAMALHSSTLAWEIPWKEEPGRLQSMGLRRVGHNLATSLSLFTFLHWRRKWQPTPAFLPGESQGRGSLIGCRLWGRAESDTTEAT